MNWSASDIKLYAEIAAFGFAALFLIGKLVTGQFNYGMDVDIDIQRAHDPKDNTKDNAAISLKLKRPDGGRIELSDIRMELSQATDKGIIASPLTGESRNKQITERNESDGVIQDGFRENGTFLPPNDGTQLAFFSQFPRGEAVLIDITIIGKRTGPAGWFGNPQWRASAVSLPNSSSN